MSFYTFSLNTPDSYIKVFMFLNVYIYINDFAVLPLLTIYIIFVYIDLPVYIFAVPLPPLLPTIVLARRTHSDNRKIPKNYVYLLPVLLE